MSYPPPPGSPGPDPHNPYAPPQGGAPYGYPQQGAPGYGYPQAGMPAYPGGPMQQPFVSMPGQVVTARVLLFIAGSLWGLLAVLMLIGGLAANSMIRDVPVANSVGAGALGAALIGFVVFGGMATLHIVPASMFGKGATGTRVTAIIGATLNTIVAMLAFFGSIGSDESSAGGSMVIALLWLATAVLTIIFCSMSQAGHWFNRPRY
ncbi:MULTISPECIES: hypothetical protein [Streptomyces]|uniref:Uncharacterized protein n=1 Tax=Streptomyces cacaoi TaxID=1898 RepID=A0A4Y3QW32_STRCI|nr:MULTISPECIES: hypothetical protein [Streptomyces]NNG89196.1 hypothetical protein [Streptomyces cacaoi]QHF97415.1 hypothetical protein DEH18_30285 [Streptomyces sp. NHF165]GEB48877.1 hypothetical protein SCA03_14280 [Streptomyces cacaoi]